MLKYTLDKLPNKIRTILAPLHDTEAVTVLVLVKVGSRYEYEQVNGISHFIEHLLFKGTKKRPTSLDITKELDGAGADFNAFTGKDHTGYYIKIKHDKLELAMDILSDMIFNSVFDETEITKEKGVIIEEINMYEDNPMFLIDNIFEELIFSGSSLGWRISGLKHHIEDMGRKQIIDYYHQQYVSSNIIVGVVGKFQNLKAQKLIEKYFGGVPKKNQPKPFKNFKASQNSPRTIVKQKETEQVHLALGFPAYSLKDPKVYPLSVLSTILGGNMSSRLFMEIREKLGLAYFVRSSLTNYEDTGAFVVNAGLDKIKIKLAVETILKELEKSVKQNATAEELSRAKEYIKGKLVLRLEDGAHLLEWLASQLLLKGKIEKLDSEIRKIDQVSLEAIRKVSAEVINRQKVNLGIIGPFSDEKFFLEILNKH